MQRFLFSLVAFGALALPAAPALAHPPARAHQGWEHREAFHAGEPPWVVQPRGHEWWQHHGAYRPCPIAGYPVYAPYPACAPCPPYVGFGLSIRTPVLAVQIGR